MMDKTQIEKLLKLNGLEPTASDEEVRGVLTSAGWHERDIVAALAVLRGVPAQAAARPESLQKVMHNNNRLDPKAVSSLLGIEMDVKPDDIKVRRQIETKNNLGQFAHIFVAAIILSSALVLGMMWVFETGMFHPTI